MNDYQNHEDLQKSLSRILVYRSIHDNLATSGQPQLDEFDLIAKAGFEIVINLALTDASNAITNEDRRVLECGMDYLNLPLLFDHPSLSQALYLLNFLHASQDKKIWLHCALNMRVSSLVYLYRTHHLAMPELDALALLHDVWTPNNVWQQLIQQVNEHYSSR
ncbi:protein tyrosine phosphatase family protein [Aquirhabdus sp.]|uniref:protein tyrosine phosphatase family protein n=1 Tax=Aquirhabdus sp. TaxID=2824160 RepID=UPI00396C8981